MADYEVVDLPKNYEVVDVPKKTAFQRQAGMRKASIGAEQTAATYENEIGAAKGQAAGDIAKGAVLGAAALGTGGLAVGPAMGLMGSAGILAGVTDESLKAHYNSPDMPQGGRALATKLGLEGILSAAGEGGARAIGQSIKYLGKEAMPALVMRSAAKAEQGQQTLVKVQQNAFDQLREFARGAGNPKVDLGAEFREFFTTIGKRATSTSQTFDDAMRPIYGKLGKAGGGVLDKQPLDALMEIKSDLNFAAYKAKGMNTDEMVALRNLAEQVDSKITSRLNALGGSAATKVYSNYKAFTEQLKRDDAALTLAETGVKRLLGIGRQVPVIGAAADALVDLTRNKAAPWILEHLFSNERTASLVKKAINLESVGQGKAAQSAFDAAINASGVGTLVKDWMKPEKRKAISPAMQEAAANLGPLSQMGL